MMHQIQGGNYIGRTAGRSQVASSPLIHRLFHGEPAGRFALGHVFHFDGDLNTDKLGLASAASGHWSCDIDDHDSLTWSDRVYELFDIPKGSAIGRADAVSRYSDRSKGVLERVRNFAIGHKCGFILDATLGSEGGGDRWIRIIAFPVLKNDRIVGLQGFKRAL
jgi:hypothetical protein